MPAPKPKRLDVRPLLARGENPCEAVESTLATMRAGQALTVVAPFLPSPLIERLRSAGYTARVERLPNGGWSVDFVRD